MNYFQCLFNVFYSLFFPWPGCGYFEVTCLWLEAFWGACGFLSPPELLWCLEVRGSCQALPALPLIREEKFISHFLL